MKFRAEEIAIFLNGEIIGDRNVSVSIISNIEEGKPGSLSFLSNPKYEPYLYDSEASIILVNRDFIPKREYSATLIKVEDAYQALASLLQIYSQAKTKAKSGVEQPSFIHDTATVGEEVYFGAFAYAGKNAKIGKRVKIYPQVYIGENVIIGDDTVVYSGAKVYDDSQIGSRCIIHSGAVIGSDGFGFAPQKDGSYQKIPQLGAVILEDDVEIGANTTIDCGTISPTIIRKGVKLDNLIQIAHKKVGEYCRIAGQVGMAGHLTVGDHVQIGAQSGVVKNVKSNETILGSPAIDVKQAIRMYTVMKNLPQLRQELIDLQKEIRKINETILKKTE